MAVHVLSPQQCRAARGLVNWSIERLWTESGVGKGTINNFELGRRRPIQSTRLALRAAFERAGVGFLAPTAERGAGVYLLSPEE